MKVRLKDRPDTTGVSSKHNIHTVSPAEVIVGFDGGDMDTVYMRDLDVWLEGLGRWKDMGLAFQDRDLISDNYNSEFREPKTADERSQGWY
jgi:hypothetical protein